MTGIKNLRLQNVRSHKASDFQFASDMNAVVGPNGSGKTTLIEALYVLMRGSSFKGSLPEMMRYGSHDLKIQLTLQGDTTQHTRRLSLHQKDETSQQRQWQIDDKKSLRLPLGARKPVVLFEPDVARLITGGPERRRFYLDNLGGQLDIELARTHNRYERTLRQRNQLLKLLREKPGQSNNQLFVWNTQLAQLAEIIIKARFSLIQQLEDNISDSYKQLGGQDAISLNYQSSVGSAQEDYGSRLLQFLETNLPRDIALGYTSFGPHRDDIQVRLADQLASERASRGEIRTVVIALKLLETKMLSNYYEKDGVKPVLLLDDVLSELDLLHQERVLDGLKDHQVFITTTDAHALTPGVHTIAL